MSSTEEMNVAKSESEHEQAVEPVEGHKNGMETPTPSNPADTLRENTSSANLSGLSSASRGRTRKKRAAADRITVHLIKLMNDRKEVLFRSISRKQAVHDVESKSLRLEGLRKRRIAWKKIASELNETHGCSLYWRHCFVRFWWMKKYFMQTHLPEPGKNSRRSPWPFCDLFRPVLRFVLNRSPVSGDDAKLKEILGSEAEPEESQVFERYQTQYNELRPVEGVQAEDADKERSDDPTTDSDSDLPKKGALKTNPSRVEWSNEATKLLLKLVKDHKEILLSRKPEDPGRYAYGCARRVRSWRRIAIEINKAGVVRFRIRRKHCSGRFGDLRRTFIDLARPVRERIESQKARKTVWPFFNAFKPIMRYICDQHPASANDRLRKLLEDDGDESEAEDSLDWRDQSSEFDSPGYEKGEVAERADMDLIHTDSEVNKEEDGFEYEEGEKEDFSDDSDHAAAPSLKAPVRTPPVARDQPRASQALRIPFEMTNSKSMRLLSTHQGTSVEKVRSWDTDSSDSDSVPARPVRSIAKLTATATGSSVSSRRRRAIVRSLSSTDSDSSETRRGTPSRKRPAGEDKSAPPKRTKLVHAPHSTTHQNSQIIQTDSNQSTKKLLREEMCAMRADIHALTGGLTQFVIAHSKLVAAVQILLDQNSKRGNDDALTQTREH